ncbi:MAG: hypothetical protein ACI4S2_14300 [Lachnospiraceae bacterium]
MKKKVLAVLTAITVMAMGSVSVMAASPTVGTTEAPVATQTTTTTVEAVATPAEYVAATTVSAGFKVEAVSTTTVQAAAVAVQNELLNDVASIGTKLGNSTLAAAATDSTKKVTASVLSVVEVDPTTAVKDTTGNYVVTLSIPTIAAGDAIAVLHYNGSAWETIVPTSVAAGSVTFATASLSPISIVKLEVASVATSPKTGSTMPMAAAVVVLGLAGAAVCGKRFFA